MLYYNQNNEFVEKCAEEFSVKNSNNKIPESGKLSGGSVNNLSFMDRLRMAIQADGNRRFYDSGYGKKPRKGNLILLRLPLVPTSLILSKTLTLTLTLLLFPLILLLLRRALY
jgi:hypothetical protein